MQEAVMVMNNHSNNKNDEWYTPQEYVEAARAVMGEIDLDPASNAETNARIGAHEYFSIENCAFKNEWKGRVWMNPPYSRVIKHFIHKLCDEYRKGTVTEAIVVTNNGTDTKWFHEMASISSGMCLPIGRIGFLNEQGQKIDNNNKGQVFTYIGPNYARFKQVFERYGRVYYRD